MGLGSSRQATYGNRRNRTAALSLISTLIIAGALLPASTHAGILSDWLAFIFHTRQSVASETSTQNVQTMTLPRAAMNIDPNPAKGGGDITIVDGSALLSEEGPSGTLADVSEVNKSDQISVYVVREGDTLSEIANMFGVTVNTIIWANDLKNATIRPGQELAILPMTGIRYTVKTGGTLQDIIDVHGGDIEEAELYNNIGRDDYLEAGTIVVIPEGEYAAPKTTTTSTARVVYSGGPSYDGYYIKPVNGVRTQGMHGYNAVDLGAPVGTPIVAAASGDVIIVKNGGWNGGYGSYVVLKHSNGTQTLYAHTSSNIVYPGQSVVQGQVIGYVGSTGRSTGPHLHFEIRGASNPF